MKVLITREIPQAGIELLKEHPEIELDYRKGIPLSPEELIKAVKGVDGIIPVIPDQITEEVMKAAGPNLKIIAHYAVGYDNIDVKAATKHKIFVSNTPGNLTEAEAFCPNVPAQGRKTERESTITDGTTETIRKKLLSSSMAQNGLWI